MNPGLYNVSVSMTGFQTSVVQGVQVQVNQSARADIHLQIGSTATTVDDQVPPLLNDGLAGHIRRTFTYGPSPRDSGK